VRDRVIIIVAQPNDAHAEVVARRIEVEHGIEVVILDPLSFPEHTKISFSPNNEGPLWSIETDKVLLQCDQIRAVWWRRYAGHEVSPEVEEGEPQEFAKGESQQLFVGIFLSLGKRVVNVPAANFVAEHKILQLVYAKECGLEIPRTLATNDKLRLSQFLESETEIIFKPFTQIASRLSETRKFKEEYIALADTLEFAPCIFQSLVKRGVDIRSTIVGDQVFSVSIETQNAEANIDWRLDSNALITPWELPEAISAKLVALARRLGLSYGAADLRLDDNGNYIFFEINPGGQFLFAEIFGGQPISAAMAKLLVSIGNGA
jgi:hypothetical protein